MKLQQGDAPWIRTLEFTLRELKQLGHLLPQMPKSQGEQMIIGDGRT